MATRPDQKLQFAVIETYEASGTVTEGFGVKYGASDHTVVNCAAGEKGIGIALSSVASGARVSILLLTGCAVMPVKVGTGGATRGAYAAMAADGMTDQALGGGTTARHIFGTFTQSGVAGDKVGLMVQGFSGVSS